MSFLLCQFKSNGPKSINTWVLECEAVRVFSERISSNSSPSLKGRRKYYQHFPEESSFSCSLALLLAFPVPHLRLLPSPLQTQSAELLALPLWALSSSFVSRSVKALVVYTDVAQSQKPCPSRGIHSGRMPCGIESFAKFQAPFEKNLCFCKAFIYRSDFSLGFVWAKELQY